MISVAPRADGDLISKTELLRASADELALKVDGQCKEIARLRGAIEQLKVDHGSHITTAISRMNDIDQELIDVNTERTKTDKRTADALKRIEAVRRELVQLGAKLAKEFILLPPAVSKYPRLEKAEKEQKEREEREREEEEAEKRGASSVNSTSSSSSSSSSSPRGLLGHQHHSSHWYTDDIPAANLEMVDMVVSSAIAALDGRIDDDEFNAEIEQARDHPESIFSKESLIQSIAASSPMKRRRGSLLMLAQASQELSKQSATMDSLTRDVGPSRWTESERLVALKTAQTHDVMIRDAVKELCKVAPIPRQAERQLLTSLNMHTMPISEAGIQSLRQKPTGTAGKQLTFQLEDGNNNEEQQQQQGGGENSPASSPLSPSSSPGSASLKKKKHHHHHHHRDQQHKYFSHGSGRHVNVPVDRLGANEFGTEGTAGVKGKDNMLKKLQAELHEEQSAMQLRTHAARVKAWQEIDLKRSARSRLEKKKKGSSSSSFSRRRDGSSSGEEEESEEEEEEQEESSLDKLLLANQKRKKEEAERNNINNNNSSSNNWRGGGVSPSLSPLSAGDLSPPSVSPNASFATANVHVPAAASPVSSTPSPTAHPLYPNHPHHHQNHLVGSGSIGSNSKNPSRRIFSVIMNQANTIPVHWKTTEEEEIKSRRDQELFGTPPRAQFPPILVDHLRENNNREEEEEINENEFEEENTQHRTPSRSNSSSIKKKYSSSSSASPSPPSSTSRLGIASEELTLAPVHRSTGLLFRDRTTEIVVVPSQKALEAQELEKERRKQEAIEEEEERKRRARARAGIPDPESATAAITMRRTGKLDNQISFNSARLDKAAERLGISRPNSAASGSGTTTGTRMRWKIHQPAAILNVVSDPVD